MFNFAELDARKMKDDLLNSMPRELFNLAADGPVTVNAVHGMLANGTAARFSDLDAAKGSLESSFDAVLSPSLVGLGCPR